MDREHDSDTGFRVIRALIPPPARPHPNLAPVYRDKVARLHEALQSGPDAREELERTRQLIERIILMPVPDGKGFEIELIGEIAAMVRLGVTVDQRDSRPISAADHAFGKVGCGDRI